MTEREAAQQGTTDDIAGAYRRHSGALVRFATVLVGPDDAPDVVSSAVVETLARGGERLTNPKAYLYRAVANQARNFKRGEARRRDREARRPQARAVATMPEPYPEVRAAVERLSVRQRAVVYLTYWEDMPDRVVADHLGIGAGSVRRHLARARRHLRRALDEYDA